MAVSTGGEGNGDGVGAKHCFCGTVRGDILRRLCHNDANQALPRNLVCPVSAHGSLLDWLVWHM